MFHEMNGKKSCEVVEKMTWGPCTVVKFQRRSLWVQASADTLIKKPTEAM